MNNEHKNVMKKIKIMYHIILCSKYRHKCLLKIKSDLELYLSQVFHFNLLDYVIDQDHIHIILEYDMNHNISKNIKLFKMLTSFHILKKLFSGELLNYFQVVHLSNL